MRGQKKRFERPFFFCFFFGLSVRLTLAPPMLVLPTALEKYNAGEPVHFLFRTTSMYSTFSTCLLGGGGGFPMSSLPVNTHSCHPTTTTSQGYLPKSSTDTDYA